jgi:hypothetical protein
MNLATAEARASLNVSIPDARRDWMIRRGSNTCRQRKWLGC